MTSDTATTTQPTQLQADKAYDEFVKKAVKDGIQSIKEGRTHDLDDVIKELDL